MRELRPYQVRGIDKLASKYAQGIMRIIFQLATGGGKTVTFAGLIQRFLQKKQQRVLILVHREELLKQAYRTLYEWYGIAAAPITAGSTYLPNVMVYVAMVETANNRLKKNPKYFGSVGLVIVDECHLGNFKKLYDHFKESLIIGFTATPVAASKKDPLKNHFKDIVCGIDIPELIEQGSLVPNKTYHIHNIKRNEIRIKNGEFDEVEMGNMFSSVKHVQNTIRAYQQFGNSNKSIIFNCNIEHSKKVNAAFVSFGYPSRHLDGMTHERERQETLAWFKNTPGAILNNVGILTTGFDEPSVINVIINKATMSLPLWLQMTGRGSRPFPGKDFFIIIDMGGNALYHGDWCDSRDWADMFFNPVKPKEGGEAPTKICVSCGVILHASVKICKHCGALNVKPPKYDEEVIKLELLTKDRPFEIDVLALVLEYTTKVRADGQPYKELAAVHDIKQQIIRHVQYSWRLKRIDDRTAYKILDIFQGTVREWCAAKEKKWNQWMDTSTKEWLFAELKRVFKWEPKIIQGA